MVPDVAKGVLTRHRAISRLIGVSVSLILNQAYDRTAEALPPDADPAEYVIILPEWGGLVSRETTVPGKRAGLWPSSRLLPGERPLETVRGVIASK